MIRGTTHVAADAYDKLVDVLDRVTGWLDKCAATAEKNAENKRFPAYADACAKDAKQYRAASEEIRSALADMRNEAPR